MKILIFGNEYQQHFAESIREMIAVLREYGASLEMEESFYAYLSHELGIGLDGVDCRNVDDMWGDVALSIGGDGTFLRTARMVATKEIPILGINAGHLGYLAEAHMGEISQVASNLFNKQYKIGRRTMLEMSNNCGIMMDNTLALNDIAVMRQDSSTMLSVRAWVNGADLTTYRGDGLVISTPTGSTAYNLSVGGPILEPTSRNWVLSPISAHSLTLRPLVLRDDSVIELETTSRAPQYLVSLDGKAHSFPSGSSITVKKAGVYVKVIQPLNHNFADTLRTKLMWGQ